MLKQRLLLVFCLYSFLINANTIYEQHYIEKYSKLAVKEMNRSGIPASIKLAQGILESSWGQSDSALKYNNHFGIKCKRDWPGDRFLKEDDDYDAQGNMIASCFRAYENAEESYNDHSMFLKNSQRYQELFSYNRTDYISWAIGLQRCGYATNKSYAVKLIDLIEKYGLYKYDKIVVENSSMLATSENLEDNMLHSTTIAAAQNTYQIQEAPSKTEVYLPFEIVPDARNSSIITTVSKPISQKITQPASYAKEALANIKTTRFRQMSRQPRVMDSRRR